MIYFTLLFHILNVIKNTYILWNNTVQECTKASGTSNNHNSFFPPIFISLFLLPFIIPSFVSPSLFSLNLTLSFSPTSNFALASVKVSNSQKALRQSSTSSSHDTHTEWDFVLILFFHSHFPPEVCLWTPQPKKTFPSLFLKTQHISTGECFLNTHNRGQIPAKSLLPQHFTKMSDSLSHTEQTQYLTFSHYLKYVRSL